MSGDGCLMVSIVVCKITLMCVVLNFITMMVGVRKLKVPCYIHGFLIDVLRLWSFADTEKSLIHKKNIYCNSSHNLRTILDQDFTDFGEERTCQTWH